MKHIDCKYYLPTDVFKGICKRTKGSIQADDAACSEFEKVPKCRYCTHFTMKDKELGLCMGKVTAYPDMKAITCKDFAWK